MGRSYYSNPYRRTSVYTDLNNSREAHGKTIDELTAMTKNRDLWREIATLLVESIRMNQQQNIEDSIALGLKALEMFDEAVGDVA